MNKPLQELAGLLGFDIPPTPAVDLASIKADGAIIHWSLPEKQTHRSTLKFEIHLNGNVIDTLSIKESAATITGLQPGCFYVVRVALVNNIEFSSKSAPIRFRTKPASSVDFYVATADGNDTDHDATHEAMPRCRPYRGLKDITPASPDAELMVREGSQGLGPRRSLNGGGGRRSSGLGIERHESTPDVHDSAGEGSETIQRLTERLDAIRRETDEAERQAKEEDEEELQQKDELVKERDELKAEAMEKERASRNLKREVNTMERQNTAAQNERSKQERLLEKKKQDHKKLKDDVVRWVREAEEMRLDVDRIQQEKEEHLKQVEAEKETLRKRQAEEAAVIKSLDDEVKEKGTEIKKLERTMKNNSPDNAEPEVNIVQQMQQDAESTRQWAMQYTQLQQEYAMTFQKMEMAKRFHSEQLAFLESLRAKRRQEEANNSFVPPPSTQDRPLRRGDSQRSRTAQSGPSSTDSPRLATFPMATSAFGPGLTSTASMYNGPAFLNIHNGMSLVTNPTDDMDMTDEERERMTGGALMSPGAGANLLPSDLFGDGDIRSEFTAPLPGLGSFPGMPGLPGLPESMRHVLAEHPGPGPASPVSASSRSPSVFASPQASQQNLHIGSPEQAVIDSDRRSIRSTRSNRATSGSGAGSRFGGMFGIKQRTKTVSDVDDGLALGKASSHSMPRQDQGIPGIDSSTRKRNSSISGTVFSGLGNDGAFDAPPQAARRSRGFNIFGSKGDGWPSFHKRPASPRPGSTHSNNELPRPSSDSSRWIPDAWSASDATAGARGSPLAFGTGWSLQQPGPSRLYGSRLPSRRPSQQYGASGPPEDIMEDEDSDAMSSNRARTLGAIGTKPPASSSNSKKVVQEVAPDEEVPKLNPNAKDFKSFFSSMKLKSRNPESGASSTIASASSTANIDKGEFEELSPPASRRSKDTRDTRSMTTTSSIAESGRNSMTDLNRTTSYTNSGSENMPTTPTTPMLGSSTGKESFMQKLTRKSSSGGKFALPTFVKRDRSRLDTGKTPSGSPQIQQMEEGSEYDEMPASAGLRERRSRDGGSARGWGSVLKLGMGGKKGGETPSVSGASLASGAGTEDGDEIREEGEEEEGKVGLGL